jgi:hypothetical protein
VPLGAPTAAEPAEVAATGAEKNPEGVPARPGSLRKSHDRHNMRAISHVLIVWVMISVYCSSSLGFTRSSHHGWSFSFTYISMPLRNAKETWGDTANALLSSFPATAEGLVHLCDRIDKSNEMYRSNFILRRKRNDLLVGMLTRNQTEYIDVVSFLASRIPRDELPNAQYIPAPMVDRHKVKVVAPAASGMDAGLQVEDCELPTMHYQYQESTIDKYFLRRFRRLVQREIGAISKEPG